MKKLFKYSVRDRRGLVNNVLRGVFALSFFWMIFLVSWFGSYTFLPEGYIPVVTIMGMVVGQIVAVVVFISLKTYSKVTSLVWLFVYIFYNICFFGFFMGVPIFNIFLVPFAALYLAIMTVEKGIEGISYLRFEKLYAVITTVIMFVVCFFSGVIALSDVYTPSNLTGMLGIYFDYDRVILLICVGGTLLLTTSVLSFLFTARTSRRLLSR